MTDFSRQTGHVAHVEEADHPRGAGWKVLWAAVCDTCGTRLVFTYRSDAVKAAVDHVDSFRGPAPAWAAGARRR